MNEYEESAGPDQTMPGGNNQGPDAGPPSSRRAGASKAAGAVAGAVTSRTAGWMVAAALAGSLVTLAVDHNTSQPGARSITIRNAGRAAQAPTGGSRHRQIEAVPAPKRIYLAPGGPASAGAPWAQAGTSWIMQPACAIAGAGGPPFSKRVQRIVTIPAPKRVVIGGQGQHNMHIQIGQVPAASRIRFARPGCLMFPLQCQRGMKIGGQVHPFTRVQIERRGRVVIVGPRQRALRRMTINAPRFRRTVVIVPSPRLSGSQGPQCVAIRPRQR